MKFLLMLVVLGLAYALWRSKRRAAMPPPPPRPPVPTPSAQPMVACAHCGVHLPHSEALAHAGQHYCSAAHRDAGAR